MKEKTEALRHIRKAAANRAVTLVFPKRCPGCHEILENLFTEEQKNFCPDCQKKIHLIKQPVCLRCGKQLRDETKEFCGDCRKEKREFLQGKAVYRYSGPMKEAMYRFKYSNCRAYAGSFADDTVLRYTDWIQTIQPDAIIPIPMYPGKKRRRGYNQAEVFARELSRRWQIPLNTKQLKRCRDTMPQKELDDAGRRENLKNAFISRENDVQLNCILLIDDIFTTGMTMNAAAKALKAAGVCKVYCLCICTGIDD